MIPSDLIGGPSPTEEPPPEIIGFVPPQPTVVAKGSITIQVDFATNGHKVNQFEWKPEKGRIINNGKSLITYLAPDDVGIYEIIMKLHYDADKVVSRSIIVEVVSEPPAEPIPEPTKEPTPEPTKEPTTEPTVEPTKEPTTEPITVPAVTPSPISTPSSLSERKQCQPLSNENS